MSLTEVRDAATIVGVIIGVMTLLKGYMEYRRNAVLGRVQHFATLKQEFKENVTLAKITELLEADDPKLAEIPPREKWRFLCFFEEVTVLLRAKLISDELVYYMFGYYATRCDRSQWFWNEAFPKDEAYWLLFFDFVARMQNVESLKKENRKAFVERIRA
ncbi:MAG TPA: hypothetical protein VJU86_05965 [Pyrinomonadaceae bacterium]|nr:hypothetical protein [Pyrinomonadaceae bacterium]